MSGPGVAMKDGNSYAWSEMEIQVQKCCVSGKSACREPESATGGGELHIKTIESLCRRYVITLASLGLRSAKITGHHGLRSAETPLRKHPASASL